MEGGWMTSKTGGVCRAGGQSGMALLCVLLVTTVLGMLAASLVFVVTTESLISGNQRTAQQVLYAADAGIERAMAGLRTLPDWGTLPGTGGAPALADFADGALTPRLGDGTILNLAQLTAGGQAESDGVYGLSANRPVWQLVAHAPLDRLTGSGPIPAYVILWMADDVDDGDGDPLRDSNGVVMLRAEAFGLRGARRRVEVSLARESQPDGTVPGAGGVPVTRTEVRMISWRVR
jgi:type II secretory pathway pseudopilin PulG